jgi:hypothetical protein
VSAANSVSKSGCASIRRPPGSTTASPQPASCCVADFLVANFTGTNRPAKLLYSSSSRAACSDDDSACRSASPGSGKIRCVACRCSQTPQPTAELRLAVRRLGVDHFFSTVIELVQHRHDSATQTRLRERCVGQTLTGMRIPIHIYVTDQGAVARAVRSDPKSPLHCGIELKDPRNICCVPLPPNSWKEGAALWQRQVRNSSLAAFDIANSDAGPLERVCPGPYETTPCCIVPTRKTSLFHFCNTGQKSDIDRRNLE